jgi:hypothetical protein
MGFVPLEHSFPAATRFLEQFDLNGFLEDIMFSEKEELMSDLWGLIVNFPYKSTQSALPKDLTYARIAIEEGIYEAELLQVLVH